MEKMRKYGLHARIMFLILKMRIHKFLKSTLGKERAVKIIKRSGREYCSMIQRRPDIGGEENMNYDAMLVGATLFSVYKASEGAVTEDVFDKMVDNIVHWKMLLKAYAKNDEFSDETLKKREKDALRSQNADNKCDWNYTFEIINDDEHAFIYSRCGICELAKRENCFNLVKYICKMDFVTYGCMGAELTRTKTIADGDSICDFHLKRKAEL